jgi:hypothetical protein
MPRYVDTENTLAELKGVDVASELEKLRLAINAILQKMKNVGDAYELSEITANVGVKCGALIFEANGSIELKWTKIKP